jgi:hypothetical protein
MQTPNSRLKLAHQEVNLFDINFTEQCKNKTRNGYIQEEFYA